MSAKLNRFEFTQQKEAIVNDELLIPVPDGYQFYSEINNGTGNRLLVITPEDYSRNEDPYESEFSLSIPQCINIGIPFNVDKTEDYKNLFTLQYPVFTENVLINEIGCRDNFGILHQNFYNDSDPTFNKILAIIFVNSSVYVAHICYNHPGYDSRNQELINLFLSVVDEWMLKFKVTTEDTSSISSGNYRVAQTSNHTKTVITSKNDENDFYTLKSDDIDVVSDCEGELTSYLGNEPNIRISNDFDYINGEAFYGNESLEKVSIPNTVIEIGEAVFCFCVNLKEAKINYAYKKIPGAMFSQCHSLEEILIPDHTIEIGDAAFMFCKNLKSITLPFGLKKIGEAAFSECESLETIVIPDSVTVIGKSAFSKCKHLKEITLSKSLELIGEDAFNGCENLESIIIPDKVKTVGDYAFRECGKLKNISTNAKIEMIGEDVFYNCKLLKKDSLPIVFRKNMTKATTPKNNANNPQYRFFTIKDGILTKVKKTIEGMVFIPDGVKKIASGAFAQCYKVSKIIVPEGVVEIERGAIGGAEFACSIILPSTLEVFGGVSTMKELTEISLPEKIKELPDNAFWWCSKLKTVHLPSNLKTIGDSAFANTAIEEIVIPDSVTHIGKSAFYAIVGKAYLKKIVMSANIVEIGDSAFRGTNIEEIKLSDTLNSIGESAFASCVNLQSVKLPNNLSVISKNAFDKCENLISVTLGNNLKEIGDGAFSNCGKLTSITIPYGVTSIGKRAFADCRSLKLVTLPSSVKKIEDYAFSGCEGLKDIYIPSSLTSFGNNKSGLFFYPAEPRIHVVKGSPADRFCQEKWISNIVYETETSMNSKL